MRRLVGVGVAVVLLVLGACGGDKEPLGPTATVPQAPTTTDPYAIPAVIDEAYVNRVLAGLDKALGDLVRLVVNAQLIPPEATERLGALYFGGVLDLVSNQLRDDQGRNFESYATTPGNHVSTVTELLSVSERCIFAAIERDYSLVAADPTGGPKRQWIALQRTDRVPDALNPTRWIYIYDGFERGRLQPPDPCED